MATTQQQDDKSKDLPDPLRQASYGIVNSPLFSTFHPTIQAHYLSHHKKDKNKAEKKFQQQLLIRQDQLFKQAQQQRIAQRSKLLRANSMTQRGADPQKFNNNSSIHDQRRQRYKDMDHMPLTFSPVTFEADLDAQELAKKRQLARPKYLGMAPEPSYITQARILERTNPLNVLNVLEHSPNYNASMREQSKIYEHNPRLWYKSSLNGSLERGYEPLESLKVRLKQDYDEQQHALKKLKEQRLHSKSTSVLFPGPHTRTKIHEQTISEEDKMEYNSAIKIHKLQHERNQKEMAHKEQQLTQSLQLTSNLLNHFDPPKKQQQQRDNGMSRILTFEDEQTVTRRNSKQETAALDDYEQDLSFSSLVDLDVQTLVAKMFADPSNMETISRDAHRERDRQHKLEREETQHLEQAKMDEEYKEAEKLIMKARKVVSWRVLFFLAPN